MQAADKAWLAAVKAVLEANIAEPDFNNSDLAAALRISERSLHRKIKAITDLTPLQYSRLYRLQQAKILLEQAEFETVKEVALAVGFVNVAYFSQRYEELFKQRPAMILKLAHP